MSKASSCWQPEGSRVNAWAMCRPGYFRGRKARKYPPARSRPEPGGCHEAVARRVNEHLVCLLLKSSGELLQAGNRDHTRLINQRDFP